MSVDRTEKLSIKRTHTATMVIATVIEDGISVSYTLKTYEPRVDRDVIVAREGADRLLIAAKKGVNNVH